MKKSVLILAGIVISAMSCLTNVALSLSENSQWNAYVLQWDQKLSNTKKKKIARKVEPMTICSSSRQAERAEQPQR